MKYSRYKVIEISENSLGIILTGASKLPLKKMQDTLNMEVYKEGWQVVFQVIESKRFLLFWQKESVVITLGK